MRGVGLLQARIGPGCCSAARVYIISIMRHSSAIHAIDHELTLDEPMIMERVEQAKHNILCPLPTPRSPGRALCVRRSNASCWPDRAIPRCERDRGTHPIPVLL